MRVSTSIEDGEALADGSQAARMPSAPQHFVETSGSKKLVDAVYDALPRHRGAFVITIDGRDGAGKTTLARRLACQLEMTALELDIFRDLSASPFDFRLPDLLRAIEGRTKRDRHVIVEGVTVQKVLDQLSVPPDFRIFVDHDDQDLPPPRPELVAYLQEFKPASQADFIFHW